MVIRLFRAVVQDGQRDAFERLFVGTLLPMIRNQDGLISASIGLPHDGSPNEFCMIMHWRDMHAVRQFAGDDWQHAVIHPDEAHMLKETFVHHYQPIED